MFALQHEARRQQHRARIRPNYNVSFLSVLSWISILLGPKFDLSRRSSVTLNQATHVEGKIEKLAVITIISRDEGT